MGIVLISPDAMELEYAIRFEFHETKNEAEYEAVLAGISIAHFMGAKGIIIRSDSQLVVEQVKGQFAAKDSKMKEYLLRVQEHRGLSKEFLIEQISREENSRADTIAQMASHPDGPTSPVGVFLEMHSRLHATSTRCIK